MSQGTETALGGRYRLDLQIATGGMGEVWRATDEVLGRPVAVKILRREYADDVTFLERFRTEARNMAALTHPGVAAVHDFGEAAVGGAVVPYIVMELVPGEPLSTIIERGGALEADRALGLVAQAASALQAAHEGGLVHRDVKPANLLVTPWGTVKVTDFGIARAADALPLTRTGTVMGTAHYLAPEMVRSRGAASPLSDVYALGVVLYECLTGNRPFPGDNPVAVALAHLHEEPPELPLRVPDPVRRLVRRAMAKDPLDRPRTAGELARQLSALRSAVVYGEPAFGHPAVLGSPAGLGEPAAPGGAPGGAVAQPVTLPDLPVSAPVATSDAPPVGTALLGVPAAADAPIRGGRRRAGRASDHRGRDTSRPHRRGVGALLVVTTLLLALAVGWLLYGSVPRSATVPKVTSLAEADARARVVDLGFALEIRREVSRTVRSGVVLEQRPIPGTQAPIHSPVLLVVSAGPPKVRVDDPDWRGRPYDEVRAALQGRGLQVSRRLATGAGTPGTVADVSPDGLLDVGDRVTATVITRPAAARTSQPAAVRVQTTAPTASASPSSEPTPDERGGQDDKNQDRNHDKKKHKGKGRKD